MTGQAATGTSTAQTSTTTPTSASQASTAALVSTASTAAQASARLASLGQGSLAQADRSVAASGTPAAASAVSSNYLAQRALAQALGTSFDNIFRILDPANPTQTGRILAAASVPLVQQFSMASRALTAEFYQGDRVAAGFTDPFQQIGTALPAPEKVFEYVGWATKPLRDAPTPAPELLEPAKVNATAALQKLVADTGRRQMIDNTLQDRHAIGWAREARPTACWFCAMLATRGAVYHSAWAAGQRTFMGVDFNSYHRNCQCMVVPVFTTYTAPAHVQDWQQLWKDSTGDVRGKAKMRAFRQAYESQHSQHGAP